MPQPFEEVFAFFADAYNLERITPPFLRFYVRSISTATIQHGTEITYRLRLHRLPISWTSRIEAWEPPTTSPMSRYVVPLIVVSSA